MLSIAVISSSAAAVSYYEQDDYYKTQTRDAESLALGDKESAVLQAVVEANQLEIEGSGTVRHTQRGERSLVHGSPEDRRTSSFDPREPTSLEAPRQPSFEAGGDSASREAREGEWYGRGAAALNLSGAVEREQFKELLEGRLPNGVTIRSNRQQGSKHTPGWDLTFSAPKSVSILAEVGQDERLFEAHQLAVREALGWLEEHALVYRKRTGLLGRREVVSRNMTAALFQHDTSRDQDPELHTHAVVLNATQREEGSWGAVHSHPLFDAKMAAGVVYRAALAREVQQAGYPIVRTSRDGLFEISSVPAKALEAFQSRREKILAWMQKRGLSGPEAAAKAALVTRPSKRPATRAELRAKWLATSLAAEFDPRKVVSRAQAAELDVSREGTPAKEAVRDAMEALSEAEATFSHTDLVRRALANAVGTSDVKSVETEITQLHAARTLERVHDNGRALWTTPRAHVQEQRALQAARDGRAQVTAIATAAEATGALEATSLTNGQRAAVGLILSTRDRIVAIVGRPGTGKTTMLTEANVQATGRGFALVGMAANAEAARKLQGESAIPSTTIHQHLIRIGRDLAHLTRLNEAQRQAIRQPYGQQIWVVDEASQVGSRLMRRLLFAAERLGSRVVLVGDPQQMAAIDAGKPLALMLRDGMQQVRMDEILRQKNSPRYKAAIRLVGDRRIDDSLKELKPDIRVVEDPNARIQAVLNAFQALDQDTAAKTLVLTARNEDKTRLNTGIRNILRERGQLDSEADTQRLQRVFSRAADRKSVEFYKPGQIIHFSAAAPEIAVERGAYLEVLAVDNKRGTLKLGPTSSARQPTVTWNPRDIPGRAKRVEIYERRNTSVAPGETVRWSRNVRELGLTNGQPLLVTQVSDETMELKADDGRVITLNTKEPRAQHWDHAYASTVYSSQGATAKNVLVNADSEQGALFSQKAFLVAVSRHRESLTIYADNFEKLRATLHKHLGDKTSAVESRKATRLSRAALLLEKIGKEWLRGTQKSLQQVAGKVLGR